MKILSVVGARPQFIKAAALSPVLRREHEEFLIHTGQHYDQGMSQAFFDELGIPAPDTNLGVGSGSHGKQTAAMLERIEEFIQQESPDAVLVYGDTNSTLAGALAASKLQVPIAHVEAGERSFDRRMPEELNRVLTDHVASHLYCSSEHAAENLRAEGITEGVHVVGDIMVDLFRRHATDALAAGPDDAAPAGYWLMTLHRPANTDDPATLQGILEGIVASGTPIVWPMHPRTRAAIEKADLMHILDGSAVIVHEPASYGHLLRLLVHATGVLTDSGGLQKESYLAGVPCLTLRDTTEWTGTVEQGWNRLVAVDPESLVAAIADPPQGGDRPDLWGDGHAADRIVELLPGLA